MTMNRLGNYGGEAGGAPRSLTFLGSQTSGSDASSYTFSAFNGGSNGLGTPASNRVIYVSVHSWNSAVNRSVSTVKVNGVTANSIINPNGLHVCSLYACSLSAGASGNIVVTTSGGTFGTGCGIMVWLGYGYADTATDTSSGTSTTADTLTTTAGGMALGGITEGSSSVPSFVSGLTDDASDAEDANENFTGGSVDGIVGSSISVDIDLGDRRAVASFAAV